MANSKDSVIETVVETQVDTISNLGVGERHVISDADIRHNMKVIIMLDAIFTTGVADLTMASTPLWVLLGASSTRIGFINSLTILALIGVFFAPFISVRFRYKKWYLFVSHIPYIGAWGVMGLALGLSTHFNLSDSWLLGFLTLMTGVNWFFGGFVSLPHQEYVAACIPMSHRGRYSAYSQGVGSVTSMGSTAVGGWVLLQFVKPMAFGYLYLMAWFFCQLGYVMALFGRERPTPIEHAPRPWSKNMLKAVWQDKPFIKLMVINSSILIFLWPVVNVYIANYGYKELKMAPALAAVLMMITSIARIVTSGPIGKITDKLHPKRMLPFWPLVAVLSIVPVLVLHNQIGVYMSTAIGAVFVIGQSAAFLALIYGLPKPENRSGHYTVQMIQNYVSVSLGPLLIGWLCDVLSFRVTFAVVAVVAIALCPMIKHLLSGMSSDARDYA
ncbi:MAG: MFS transporter [Armatimonadetes bacterium]|nr:MFS transporter [Armatimonadota bacterium]